MAHHKVISQTERAYRRWIESDLRKQRIEELQQKYPKATNIQSVADGYCTESEIIESN